MIEIFQDKKVLVILGLCGVYLVYRLFLKEDNSEDIALENEYNKVLNSKDNKIKGQWE